MDEVPGMMTTPSQNRAEAYTWACEMAEKDPSDRGVEFWMVQYMVEQIDEVQYAQFRAQAAPVEPPPLTPEEEMEAWRLQQELEKAEQKAAVFGLTSEEINQLMEFAKQFVDQVGTVMAEIANAFITAMRPIQSLLDEMEGLPGQPPLNVSSMRITPLCPSHGRPMRGGRCPMCDRGRR